MSGSTIIFSIHQPRYAIYKLCDTVMLLGNGRTMYHGPALEGMEYFNTLGMFKFDPPTLINFSRILLEKICKDAK